MTVTLSVKNGGSGVPPLLLSVEDRAKLLDAGNKSQDHYKKKLSPFRYKLRAAILPLIRSEIPALTRIQFSLRHPLLDLYFAWTANLASHTFYVLLLPLPIWYGGAELTRDLVFILGFGIYITGTLKDFLCLPRPRSPPLHRITMSGYTTKEYGFPSSHSANATGVSLLLFVHFYAQIGQVSTPTSVASFTLLFIYYASLIFGRVYCGMHGFFDIITGSFIGCTIFLARYCVKQTWDHVVVYSGSWFFPPALIAFYLGLIHLHADPVDDCPCFDDSVAFIGVLLGYELSYWAFVKYDYSRVLLPYVYDTASLRGAAPVSIPFSLEKLGLFRSAARSVVGVVLVVVWKAVSKPLLFTVLPPVYKKLGVYLPRSGFTSTALTKDSTKKIRRSSIHINEGVSEMTDFVRSLGDNTVVDSVGVENDIDFYENIDAMQKSRQRRSDSVGKDVPSISVIDIYDESNTDFDDLPVICGALKPRYDVEVIARLIVYAGVSSVAIWGFAVVVQYTPFM
ncbi:hypothetical protein BABINDRAFT_161487 [Babjeviella inositovora NRRL Y-12698]|uniref:Phosphatidic acid phosphatase type 2/haloperoxidase domain-containing protein n=1 Tax=Babjeviella inositovora NRRL Y-12698 TaxID=984486 RepID=A0A1E3QQ16_9ASCO|nr:uncharacterized protein BABINDRAFT_161487 [Babjeviella inositovora NRRL Y-12698]ODQ79793.1 hypothetical protein BABINDRAFT_161487 [Babjeviella inositovora NRRL Y-12698]